MCPRPPTHHPGRLEMHLHVDITVLQSQYFFILYIRCVTEHRLLWGLLVSVSHNLT